MEDDGDQTGGAVLKRNAALRPARLKGFDLFLRLCAVCGGRRSEQRAEFGRAVPAEGIGICGQCLQVQKEGVLALRLRLVRSGSDKFAEQAECRDAAVIAGEASVFLCPQVLHLVGVILGIRRRGALKAHRQPFALDAGIEPVHTVQEAADPVLPSPGIRKRFGEQALGVRVCQIGVRRRLQRRLDGVRLCGPAAAREGCEHEAARQKHWQEPSFQRCH